MGSDDSSFSKLVWVRLFLETLLWDWTFLAEMGGCFILGGLFAFEIVDLLLFSNLLKIRLRSLEIAGLSFLAKFLKTYIPIFYCTFSNSRSDRLRIYLLRSVSPRIIPFGYSLVSAFCMYSSFSKIRLMTSTLESLSLSRYEPSSVSRCSFP